MNNKEIKISIDKLQELHKILTNYPAIAKEQVENEMFKCFGKDVFQPQDVRERIKTFEDACAELGEDHPYVRAYKGYVDCISEANKDDKDVVAYLKLRIITTVLNEGWKPEFKPGEWRYAPYFVLYTQDEIDKMDEETRARVVYRSNFYANAYGGVSCASSSYDSGLVYASIGCRLAFKDEELAEYAGKQFIEIYADMLLGWELKK